MIFMMLRHPGVEICLPHTKPGTIYRVPDAKADYVNMI